MSAATAADRLLEHADRVRDLAEAWEQDRKVRRLDRRLAAGDEHLRGLRDRRLSAAVAERERVHEGLERRRALLDRQAKALADNNVH